MIKEFIRGGQTSLHSVRMFGQIFKRVFLISVIIFLAGISFLVYKGTSSQERYFSYKFVEAEVLYLLTGSVDSKIEVIDSRNTTHQIPVKNFLQSKLIQTLIVKLKYLAIKSVIIMAIMTAIFSCCLIMLLMRFGTTSRSTKHIRGAKRASNREIKQIIGRKNRSDFNLGNIPLVSGADKRHFLVSGLPGTGKSVATKEILDQVRAKGQKAIIYDIDQAFVSEYFREGKDVILNPLDERCPNWNIWAECQDFSDYKRVSESLIPQESTSDPFWVHAARTVLASSLEKLKEQGNTSTKTLLEYLFSSDTDGLHQLVKGTVAEPMTSDKVDKMALSILATLAAYCSSLLYLKEPDNKEIFSIKKWLQESDSDSWLFFSTTQDKKSVLAPLLSVWVDVAIQSLLSLPPDDNRKVWFFIDEFPSLHKLPSVIDLIVRARKFGGCLWACAQDESQIYSVYGDKDGKTLMRTFGTRLYFRTNEEAAKRAADYFGLSEVLESKEGVSYGAHEMRDGVSLNRDKRKEHIILPSEISNLDDLESFIKMPGSIPATKIKFDYKSREKINLAIKEREVILSSKAAKKIESAMSYEKLSLAPKIEIDSESDATIEEVVEDKVVAEPIDDEVVVKF